MFAFCKPTMTARRVAAAIRTNHLSRVIIDPRPRPQSDPRNYCPSKVVFTGERSGQQWTLASYHDLIDHDPDIPSSMSKLFARIVRGQGGEAVACASSLRRFARQFGLKLIQNEHEHPNILEVRKS